MRHRTDAPGRSRETGLEALETRQRPTALVFFIQGLAGAASARNVREAVRALDPLAKAWIDVASQRLEVRPDTSDAEDLVEILAAAGFLATLASGTGHPRNVWQTLDGQDDAKGRRRPFVANSAAGVSETVSLLPVGAFGRF